MLANAAYVETIRANGREMALAGDAAGPNLEIPTCPGWTMRDLVRHTGRVHRWAAGIVGHPRTEVWKASPDEIVGQWPLDASLGEWLWTGVERLVEVLESAPVDLQCWTFMVAPSPLAFWARRQAHETAIHRADAELARGSAPVFEAEFAADGIDELLVAALTRRDRGPGADLERTMAISPTDTDDRWLSTIGPGLFATARSTDPAECEISGTASELYLFLWNRLGPASVDVVGDRAVLDVWREGARI